MRFSKTAKQSGASGFFFDGDKNAPVDSIEVSSQDAATAINLPAGATFDFDADGTLVVTPAPALNPVQVKATAAAAKWEAIKAERDRRTEQGGYKVGTKWFHSDQKSRSQQLGLARKADRIEASGGDLDAVMHDVDGNLIAWKTMGGEFVALTARLAQQIASSAEASDISIHKAAEIHKAAMEASADPSAYDFSGGWPATFAG